MLQRSRILLTMVILVLSSAFVLLSAPNGAAASPTPRGMEQDFIALVNVERAKAGLGALAEQTDIRTVARGHSSRMAQQWRLHHNPTFSEEITGWRRVAENVGYGPTVLRIHDALMNSESHRRNILDDQVIEIGIGVVVKDDRIWVTQNFRRPIADVPANAPSTTLFGDVAATSVHASSIEHVSRLEIAPSCGISRYCPGEAVTRAQFAGMLVRALDLDRPAASEVRFVDLTGDAARDAEALAAAGLTTGCSADRFCPDRQLTREQMATFFARALELEPVEPPFTDIGRTHRGSVGALERAGIVNGCGTDRFCPTNRVTRAQTASMLSRNLG